MTNWTAWKQRHKKELWHVAGYEELFVNKVLSQIPQISPSDVTPQYRFVDSTGKPRYIDFMIINKAKGYQLPIELDGLDKDKEHAKWNDFLKRQNDLISQFGTVLRFSNKQMFDDPIYIIREIQKALSSQHRRLTTIQVPTTKLTQKPKVETAPPEKIVNDPKLSSGYLLMGISAVVIVAIIYVVNMNQQPTRSEKLNTEQLIAEDIDPISRVERVPHISAHNAVQYIGTNKLVCGSLAEIHQFRSGVYLNFVKTYPDTPFTAVVWDSLYEQILQQGIGLEYSLHKDICVEGEISSYNGRTQVVVHSLDNLTF